MYTLLYVLYLSYREREEKAKHHSECWDKCQCHHLRIKSGSSGEAKIDYVEEREKKTVLFELRVLFWLKKEILFLKRMRKWESQMRRGWKIIIGFITTKATGLSESFSRSNAHGSQGQGGEDWTWRNGDSKSIQSTNLIVKETRNVVIGLVEIWPSRMY